jgi:hypothetical protein
MTMATTDQFFSGPGREWAWTTRGSGWSCGGGEAGGAGRGPLRAFVRRAVTAHRPCGIPAAVRPLSAVGEAGGHDSGAPGFRPRR